MNRQQVFNKVYAHALTMTGPSMAGTMCAYRGENGSKCLVGALVTDSAYISEMEGLSVTEGITQRVLSDSGVDIQDANDVEFLDRLQVLHDDLNRLKGETFKVALMSNLRRFAIDKGLLINGLSLTQVQP